MTLTAAVRRETQPSAPLPIPHNSTERQIRAKSEASRLSTAVLKPHTPTGELSKTKNVSKTPYVDYFDYHDD